MAPSTTKVTETAGADVSLQVNPTETVTETSQVTSKNDVTETAEADKASVGPTAASAPEGSADASTPRAAKLVGRPAMSRPVVRGSAGVGQQRHDLPHRGNSDQPTTHGAAASDGAATAGDADDS